MTDEAETALVIDCSGVKDVNDFWNRYVAVIGHDNCRFFGRNLDALRDSLEGGGPGSPDASRLSFINIADLEAVAGTEFVNELRALVARVSNIDARID